MVERDGPIATIVAEFYHYSMALYRQLGSSEQTLANIITPGAIHTIDLVRYLGGDVAAVHASADAYFDRHPDSFTALIRFEGGANALLNYNLTSPVRIEKVSFHGRQASAFLVGLAESCVVHQGDLTFDLRNIRRYDPSSPEWSDRPYNPVINGWWDQARFFVDCVKEGREPAFPASNLEDAVKTMELIDLIGSQFDGVVGRSGRAGVRRRRGGAPPPPVRRRNLGSGLRAAGASRPAWRRPARCGQLADLRRRSGADSAGPGRSGLVVSGRRLPRPRGTIPSRSRLTRRPGEGLLRKVAATAFVVQILVSVVLLAVFRPPSGARNPVPRRPASDLDAERLRLARRRASIEGRTEPDRARIPHTGPRRRPRRTPAGIAAGVAVRGRRRPRGRRRRIVVPLGIAFLALLVASTAIVPFAEPEAITALPPSTYAPIAVTGVTTPITVDREPDSAIVVEFSVPMDPADVASRLVVEPAASVRLTWSDDATRLTIEAGDGWQRGTYYTITIPAGALDATGAPLESAVRARSSSGA